LRAALLTASLCAAAVLGWQTLVVHSLYAGDWTGVFCIGSQFPQPPELRPSWVFPNTAGYDGQFYRIIAHDPWMTRGFARYVDNPRLRYRRILVPLVAHAAAAGKDSLIDGAYIATILLAIFLGVFWSALFAQSRGLPPWIGAIFVIVPAVLVSIDRMTVDVALASLIAGFLYYRESNRTGALYAVLLAAALARDTGLVLLAAWIAALAWERRFAQAAMFISAAIPALVWYVLVAGRTPPDYTSWFGAWPFAPFLARALHPPAYPLPAIEAFAATALDYAALAGMAVAVAIVLWLAWRRTATRTLFPLLAFTALLALVSLADLWSDAYSFARAYSPLLLLLAGVAVAERRWLPALPLLASAPRVLLQFAAELQRILAH